MSYLKYDQNQDKAQNWDTIVHSYWQWSVVFLFLFSLPDTQAQQGFTLTVSHHVLHDILSQYFSICHEGPSLYYLR